MQSQLAADPGPNRLGRASPPTSAEGDSERFVGDLVTRGEEWPHESGRLEPPVSGKLEIADRLEIRLALRA